MSWIKETRTEHTWHWEIADGTVHVRHAEEGAVPVGAVPVPPLRGGIMFRLIRHYVWVALLEETRFELMCPRYAREVEATS